MLTKTDLNQISGLLDLKLDEKLEPIKKDIQTLKTDVQVLKTDVQTLKKSVSRIRRDQGAMLDLLDGEQMQQRKRITRLEKHAGLPISQ
jgi:archaellum component FlaC